MDEMVCAVCDKKVELRRAGCHDDKITSDEGSDGDFKSSSFGDPDH